MVSSLSFNWWVASSLSSQSNVGTEGISEQLKIWTFI